MSAALENIQEAFDIGFLVGLRIGDGVAHSGLCGEIDDAVGLEIGKHLLQGRQVGKVGLQPAVVGMRFQLRMAIELELHRVVVVEIIETKDRMAVVQQTTGQMEADKAGGASDEDVGHKKMLKN